MLQAKNNPSNSYLLLTHDFSYRIQVQFLWQFEISNLIDYTNHGLVNQVNDVCVNFYDRFNAILKKYVSEFGTFDRIIETSFIGLQLKPFQVKDKQPYLEKNYTHAKPISNKVSGLIALRNADVLLRYNLSNQKIILKLRQGDLIVFNSDYWVECSAVCLVFNLMIKGL